MKYFFKLVCCLLLAPLSLLAQNDSVKQQHIADSLRKTVKGVPVIPFNDTLFYIYCRQGSFSAKERADAVSKRINTLSEDYFFNPDSLKVISSEFTQDILFDDIVIVSISDKDALFQGTTKEKLAAKLCPVIGNAVVQDQLNSSWKTTAKEAGMAVLVILMMLLIIYGIHRLFKWLMSAINKRTKGAHISKFVLLNAQQEIYVIAFGMKIIKWVFMLLVIYLTLPVLFRIFPFTRDMSDILLGYIIGPLEKIGNSIWNYIPDLITMVVLIIVFRFFLRFVDYLKTEVDEERLKIPGFYADWAKPTYQIVRVLVLAFMLIVIYPYMPGSDTPIFKGVSVFVGVLFTFGSASALGNVISGLVMTYMRAFQLGDRVKIGEVTGDIIEKNLLVTRVKTIFNEIISIPNSSILSTHTINFSSEAQQKGLIVHTTVTIGYTVPWRQVHQLLIDASLNTPLIEKEPAPYVHQTSLDNFYVSYTVHAFTRSPNEQDEIYSHLHANIQDQFNEAGIEIMSPHYNSWRDGNLSTIVTDLPKQ